MSLSLKSLRNNRVVRKFLGFSTVGVFITLLSLSLTFIFLELIKTPLILTYACIYFVTILVSYFLNSRLVFKSGKSFRKLMLYFGVYISGMLLGVLVLKFYEQNLNFKNYVLSYLVIPFTMSWNFILSSLVLKKQKSKNK